MRIALVQSCYDTENGSIDRDNIYETIAKLSLPGDFWILPEAFDSGWNMNLDREVFGQKNVDFFHKIANNFGVNICGSFYDKVSDNLYYNRFCFVSADNKEYFCEKRHLFGDFEKNYVKPGNSILTFALDGFRFRAVICYDLRFPVWCRNSGDYDALVCVSQWPMSRSNDRNLMLAARSMENVAYVLNANALGGSAVYLPDGRLDFLMAVGQNVGFYEIDLKTLNNIRNRKCYLLDSDQFNINF